LDPEFLRELKQKHQNAEVEIRIFPAQSNAEQFTEADFWHIISLLDWTYEDQDDNAVLEPAIAFFKHLG